MADLPLSIPVGPEAIRIFAGYRADGLSRDEFYHHLGETFMPGTPYMLAPLALNAYVPAVLDLKDGLPDEVALIVYTSLDFYQHFRGTSLRRRVYTHSHAGVFDMSRSRGQFPGIGEPQVLEGTKRYAWTMTDTAVDWQNGTTNLYFLTGQPEWQNPVSGNWEETTPMEALRRLYFDERPKLIETPNLDQAVFLAAPKFAAVWLHGPSFNIQGLTNFGSEAMSSLGLLPKGMTVARALTAEPVAMPTLTEGVEITGPSAFTFRFVRELRFSL